MSNERIIENSNQIIVDFGNKVKNFDKKFNEIIQFDKVDILSKADEILYLFGNDVQNWEIVGQRSSSFYYNVGFCIKDINSNKVYKCTQEGITSESYPAFSSNNIIDGGVNWQLVGEVTNWVKGKNYNPEDCVIILELSYVCIKTHISSVECENLKLINGVYHKKVLKNNDENKPNLLLTVGYDTVNKVNHKGMSVCSSAMQVSSDGKTFNIIDTPMNFKGQDFSPLFHNGKFYFLNFTKTIYNDFGLYITQNFKDYVETELNLGLSSEQRYHVWFGQWFKDEVTGKLYILYSHQHPTIPMVTHNEKQYVNLRLYKVEVLDLENFVFGTPTEIVLSDNSRFDVFIKQRNGIYYLFTRRYVDENDNSHEGHVEIWSSTDVENWSNVTSRIPVLNNSGYECMSVVEDNGKYYMYLSINNNNNHTRMHRIESTDLMNWTNNIELPPTTLNLNEFGTVVNIKDQETLTYLYNYITINDRSRNILKPTNYLKLESNKATIWRNLNYPTRTLNVISGEDVFYSNNVNDTDIIISNIACSNELPHRLFIRANVGEGYLTLTSEGNIYLQGVESLRVYKNTVIELVFDNTLNEYVIVSPKFDYNNNARYVNLNDLASDNTIDKLTLENNCVYTVNVNTSLTVNSFEYKHTYNGEFNVYFLVMGEGISHTTSLKLMNNSTNILVAKHSEDNFITLISSECGNKFVNFKRVFGTGALYMVK